MVEAFMTEKWHKKWHKVAQRVALVWVMEI